MSQRRRHRDRRATPARRPVTRDHPRPQDRAGWDDRKTHGRRPERDARARRAARDRGTMTLQFAILFPIVLTLIFTTVQVALYSYARSVALTAAHRGVNAQRALGHRPNAGRDAARSFLSGFGQPYSSFNPTVSTLNGEVTVIVRGHTESVIPFFTGFDITQSASGPVEEFQP